MSKYSNEYMLNLICSIDNPDLDKYIVNVTDACIERYHIKIHEDDYEDVLEDIRLLIYKVINKNEFNRDYSIHSYFQTIIRSNLKSQELKKFIHKRIFVSGIYNKQ